ncbi:glutathione S-transferase family protein [Comamonas aquatica]|uniref:glutathione S-transferase family protein n=1 Tax=Comamonas aquatica TaxID=225991 RepID=UPI0005AA9581|nr:glutathione S-transferase family protein [Comamonas aquatica]
MQLFLNATSPFARVARIAALEKGLAERVQLVWSDPWNHDPALLAVHPQLRIPVLVTDEGQAIAESLLIAQYLDQIGTGPALVPPAQCAAVLAQASVGYGLMEAAFAVVIARKYQGAEADASVLGQRRLAALGRTLAQLEQMPPRSVGADFSLDQITVAVGLEYVRFRLPALLPAETTPRLHAWLEAARQRPSLHATRFE